MISFLREFWAFLRVRKKFWLLPDLHRHGHLRRTDRADQGLGGGALHLHDLLRSARVRVLGISAFYHDSAAALVEDGRIVAAAQEERFTRKKFDAGYPRHAIDYCLSAGNIKLKDVDSRRLLRQAIHQIRAPAGNLPHLQPARLHVVPHGAAAVAAREAVSEIVARRRAQGDRARFRLGRSA